MPAIVIPSKEQIRVYMQQRREAKEPPETPERIRELLGWRMLEDELAAKVNTQSAKWP